MKICFCFLNKSVQAIEYYALNNKLKRRISMYPFSMIVIISNHIEVLDKANQRVITNKKGIQV